MFFQTFLNVTIVVVVVVVDVVAAVNTITLCLIQWCSTASSLTHTAIIHGCFEEKT